MPERAQQRHHGKWCDVINPRCKPGVGDPPAIVSSEGAEYAV
jgi:hypothetical protein